MSLASKERDWTGSDGMNLLNIRDNKPFVKKPILKIDDKDKKNKGKNKIDKDKVVVIEDKIEYLRDWVFINFSYGGEWTIKVNEECQKGVSLRKLEQIFNELRALKQSKHRSSVDRRLVIWANNLVCFKNLISALCGHKFKEFETSDALNPVLMWIWDKDFEFRNFNAIAGEEAKRIGNTYGLNGNEVDIMESYFKLQKQDNWATFRYTASHNFEKMLEKRIEQQLTEEEKKAYRIETYRRAALGDNKKFNEWARKGCLSGAIWCEKSLQRKPINWVSSFDISQAYGGQFVRANDFPLGVICDALTLPKEEVMKRNWYAFVFEFDTYPGEVFQWMIPFEEKGKWYLFMEKTDIDCMGLMGARFKIKPKIIHQFICDKDVGYLHYKVRKTINDLYNERQKLKENGDKTEKIVKQICEIAYGKGLQKRDGRHYFCPQISYHALAKTRYELLLMMKRVKKDIVAIDTDGIKIADKSQKCVGMFFERNEEIKEELAAAGFPNTKIGTWKWEGTYKTFIQYEKKVYAYEDENGLHCKFAGCNNEQLKQFLLTCQDMNGLLNCLAIPGGVIQKALTVQDDFYAVETFYRDYSLVKSEMDAFFSRQKIVCMSA